MKNTLITLILYIYVTFIQEDWDLFSKLGKMIIFPFWLIRSISIWILSPILCIGYYIEKSEIYSELQQIKEDIIFVIEELKSTYITNKL